LIESQPLPTREGQVQTAQIGAWFAWGGRATNSWEESEIRARMEKLKAGGLTLANMMIVGFPNAIYGRPSRDAEIEKVQQSIRAAGRAGLPVVEYNFYAHHIVEGY
jgi:mannonate dehydratase